MDEFYGEEYRYFGDWFQMSPDDAELERAILWGTLTYPELEELFELYEYDVPEDVIEDVWGRGMSVPPPQQGQYQQDQQDQQDQEEQWEQNVQEQEDVIAQRRHDRLEQQDRERRDYVPQVSDEARDTYYTQMFGPGYKSMTFYDAIEMEDKEISSYIAEDPDNIVFVIMDEPKIIFSSRRSVVQAQMAFYDCDDESLRYISLANLGYHGTGVADYDAVKRAVLHSNYQMCALRPTGRNTGKLISHEIRHFDDTVVGGYHCQEGSQMPYYQTFIPPSA